MKKRTSLILLFLVFFVPVVISVLLHSDWFEWRPDGTRAHGELIEPVVELGEFRHEHQGEVVERDDLLDRWQLTHVTTGGCDEVCLESLYWLRQIRTAQDRHQLDIGLMLVAGETVSDETRSEIRELSEDFAIVDGATGAELSARFPDSPGQRRYILDPDANIIMSYAEDADPNGIRRDLRRLLTWTQRD